MNTALLVVAALLLTFLGQAIAARSNISAVFSSAGGMFPVLIPLAATIFVVMLQLTFVCDRWPFDKMRPLQAGLGALALSWAVGVLVSLTVINWNVIPAPARAALGLFNPGGPVAALDFVSWLVCVAVVQVVFFQLLDGWPFHGYKDKLTRLVVSNVFAAEAGWLLYLLLHDLFKWPDPTIAGAVIVALEITAMAFGDYPFHKEPPGLARLGLVMNVLGMALLSFFVLRLIGNAATTFKAYPADLWVGVSALNYITTPVIFLYMVWGPWRLPAPAPPVPDDALEIDEIGELRQAVTTGQAAHASAGPGAAPPSAPAPGRT